MQIIRQQRLKRQRGYVRAIYGMDKITANLFQLNKLIFEGSMSSLALKNAIFKREAGDPVKGCSQNNTLVTNFELG